MLGSWTEGYIGNSGFARIIFALVISKTPNPHKGQCLRQEDIHNQIMGILAHEDRECLYSLGSPYSILPLLKNIRKTEATSWNELVVRPPDAPLTLHPGQYPPEILIEVRI